MSTYATLRKAPGCFRRSRKDMLQDRRVAVRAIRQPSHSTPTHARLEARGLLRPLLARPTRLHENIGPNPADDNRPTP